MADQGRDARRALQRLESLERAGVTHLPKSHGIKQKPAAVSTSSSGVSSVGVSSAVVSSAGVSSVAVPIAAVSAVLSDPPPQIIPATERPKLLEIIRDQVAGCTRCSELAATRTQTVFGVGNPNARLMLIGEAPGADEDRTGEPFVGRAGQLLTKIIEACQLTREEVFIANVLKCRPPDNRPPAPDEVANCRGYLERQIAVIQPEYICCLGTFASQGLLSTDVTIGQLRGKFHDYKGIPVMCTYHPSYLLRNPAAKRHVWDDMKSLMKRMGVEL